MSVNSSYINKLIAQLVLIVSTCYLLEINPLFNILSCFIICRILERTF